mgnify:CR=1 FL=1
MRTGDAAGRADATNGPLARRVACAAIQSAAGKPFQTVVGSGRGAPAG